MPEAVAFRHFSAACSKAGKIRGKFNRFPKKFSLPRYAKSAAAEGLHQKSCLASDRLRAFSKLSWDSQSAVKRNAFMWRLPFKLERVVREIGNSTFRFIAQGAAEPVARQRLGQQKGTYRNVCPKGSDIRNGEPALTSRRRKELYPEN